MNRPHLRHLLRGCPRSCLRHCPKRQQDGVSDTHRHNNIYPYGKFIRYMYKIAVSFFCSFRSPPFVCNFTNHSMGDSPPPPPPPCPSLSHSSHSSHSPLLPISGNQGVTTHLVTMATGLWCDHGLMLLLPSPYSDIIPLIIPARMVTSYMCAFGKRYTWCFVEHNDLY